LLTSGNQQDAADPQADLGAIIPALPVDASAVLAQLERILASSPFPNSKRYPALLRYVVEKHLNGASSELKEGTIAIDVFGRDPYYDPAVDPVVRISAGEVRKSNQRGCCMAKYTKDADALSRLSREQFRVTQQSGTERPFENAYWDHDAPGIYVDIVSGEPLFSSLDKFDSDCGWPSFTKPVDPENVEERSDNSLE
jgi:hypothetical protein